MSSFLVFALFRPIVNGFYKLVYGIYFGIIKAIAWTLDMLTQLFFVFAGMTPVAGNVNNGEVERVDIVNFFLTQTKFQKAYLQLCLVALGLIVVFTLGRIIKQDYFDRAGPRSKGPIFRNVALSFIAFICIIPVFYFLVSATGALALTVMKAMGYTGGGVGSMLFNMSWNDNGVSFQAVGLSTKGLELKPEVVGKISDFVDNNNFEWYPKDTYFHFKINEATGDAWTSTTFSGAYANIEPGEFYWFIFFFGGLVVIVHLAKMMLAMITRMYNLIALFIVAPSPISQIVLDEGAKFKNWKDKVIQESVKVIGCVMSFMLFIMIITSVNNLDLMMFVDEKYAASASNIIDVNNLTSELSNVNLLYIRDAEGNIEKINNVLNALGKVMIIVAGAGAISDIDSTITPFLAGGSSSADLGNAGKGLASVAGKVASGAMQITGGIVGAAAGGVASAVGKRSLAKKQARSEMEGALKESDDKAAKEKAETPTTTKTPGGSDGGNGGTEGGGNSGANEAAATPTNGSGAAEAAAANENADNKSEGASNPEGTAPEGADKAAGGAENPEGVASPEDADKADDGASNPEGTTPEGADKSDDGSENPEGVASPEDADKTDDGASNPEGTTPEGAEKSDDGAEKSEGATKENAGGETEKKASDNKKSGNTAGSQPKVSDKKANKKINKMARKYGRSQGRKAFWKEMGKGVTLGLAKTTGKTALRLLGLAATTTLHSVGMGSLADGFSKGFSNEVKKTNHYSEYKKEGKKFDRPNAVKEAKKKEKLNNAAVNYQNWKTVTGNLDAIKNGTGEIGVNGAEKSSEEVGEMSNEMFAAATNLENCAEVANDNAAEAGGNLNPELTYSGSVEQEQKYDIAVSDDNAAGEQLQKSQQEYNDAKATLDGMSTNDAGYEAALNNYNNASTKLEKDKKAKEGTEASLATVTQEREELATINKTAMYNHVKAKENLQNVVADLRNNEEGTEENYAAREKLSAATSNLASTSKTLSKEINRTNNNSSSRIGKSQTLNKQTTKPVSSGVMASEALNSGIRKDARMGAFTDASKADADRIVSDSTDSGSSLETKARQTNAASKALGMAQDADLTYSGDFAVEDKYNQAKATYDKYQEEFNSASDELESAKLTSEEIEAEKEVGKASKKMKRNKEKLEARPKNRRMKKKFSKSKKELNVATKKLNTIKSEKLPYDSSPEYVAAKEKFDVASKKMSDAKKDLDVVVKVRETQAKKNNTTMYKYAKAKEGLQAANQELQETPDDNSKQNVKVRIKLNKAQAAYNAASNELSQKVDSNDAENLRTSVVGPTRQRKLPNKKMAVEIISKLDNDSTGQQQIGSKFSEAAYCALASDTRKNDTRARMNTALNDLPDDCELNFAEGELEKAIRSIDTSKATDKMDARGISSATEYASDLKARYEKASDSYKTNVNKAKTAMQSFNASKDPQMLKQVKDAIAAAYADSDQIHDIKVELKDVSSD